MKASRTIIVAAVLLATGAFILPALSRARVYSGPGVHGNLVALEVAKARWVDAHRGGAEWPTMADVSPYLTNGAARFGQVRPVYREIYIINKVGAPVYAYHPKTGRLYSYRVSSNDLPLIEQLKE